MCRRAGYNLMVTFITFSLPYSFVEWSLHFSPMFLKTEESSKASDASDYSSLAQFHRNSANSNQ